MSVSLSLSHLDGIPSSRVGEVSDLLQLSQVDVGAVVEALRYGPHALEHLSLHIH